MIRPATTRSPLVPPRPPSPAKAFPSGRLGLQRSSPIRQPAGQTRLRSPIRPETTAFREPRRPPCSKATDSSSAPSISKSSTPPRRPAETTRPCCTTRATMTPTSPIPPKARCPARDSRSKSSTSTPCKPTRLRVERIGPICTIPPARTSLSVATATAPFPDLASPNG